MADVASIGHLSLPQMVVSHLRPAATWEFYNVFESALGGIINSHFSIEVSYSCF